ncbi:MAG: hypothetical protein KDK97_14490 [Verrucomicrobiales bacterium]|nr:hypothetical protein [Verrucomicrobiales bacterium]MCP5557778.1 hypothetical protein [Verrucomicrobiaceae bacterium]
MFIAIRLTLCACLAFTFVGCTVARTAAGLLRLPFRMLNVENNHQSPKRALEADRGQQVATAGNFVGNPSANLEQAAPQTAAR